MSWRGGWGRALQRAVCEPFAAETGVPVRQAYHVGLLLPHELQRALAMGARPPFDVVWSNSVPALRAAEQGFCQTLGGIGERDGLSQRARAGGGALDRVVFPYAVHYVLVYRRAAVREAPRSWAALLDPRHRGRVALYPRGNGLQPIAQVMGGGRLEDIPSAMEPCWRFVEALAPQVGELDYSIGMERLLQDGQLDLCFRALTNALAFQQAGVDVDWCVPDEGTTDTLDALWLPRGVPEAHAQWARRLIDFALRPDVQTRFCELLGCMPMHRDAAVPACIRQHPRLPDHVDDLGPLLHVPEALKLAYDAEWGERFDRAMARGRAA